MITLNKQTTKKSDGRSYTYWVIRWRASDGRRYGKTLGRVDKMSKRQAEKERRKKEAELFTQPGRRNRSRGPGLAAYLEQYFKNRKRELAHGSMELHQQTGRYLTAFFGPMRTMDSVHRDDARAFGTALASGDLMHASDRPRPLKPATVDLHIRNARTIFNHALADDLIIFNPFDRLTTTQPVPRDWHYVDAEEFSKLYEAARTLSWRLLLGLARWAALRRGEALNLRWHNIDWDVNRLTVIGTDYWEPKDKEPRVVPICPELHAVLLDAFECAPEGDSYVITKGTINLNNVWRDFGVLCRRADVARYAKPFHTLRKSGITDWAKVHPAHVVQEWAGHASVETTTRHYLKVSELEYERAATTRLMPEVTQLWTQLAETGADWDQKQPTAKPLSSDAPKTCKNSGRADSDRRRPAWESGSRCVTPCQNEGYIAFFG